MLAHEIDVAVAVVVSGTDFEIESYKYILYECLCECVVASIRNDSVQSARQRRMVPQTASVATLNAIVAEEIAKPI